MAHGPTKQDINNISGTVTLPTGASTSAKQDTVIGHLDGVEGLLTTIDGDTGTIAGAVSGSEMQVDIVSAPTLTVNAHAVTNAGTFAVQVDGAALTSLQLADDVVATLGTTTYTEATTKGTTIGAVRRDADTTLVDTTNEIGPLQMNAAGQLKVEVFSGETLPVSGTVTANLSATDNAVLDAIQVATEATQTALAGTLTVTGGGGGTEYTEDAAAAANPVGNTLIMVREDGRAGSLTTADGDNVAARGNNKGELYVKTTDSDALLTTIDADTGNISTKIDTVAGAVSGTEMQVDVVGALPAGTNAIGKLAANSGVDIGDTDVTSVIPGTGATNLGKAIDTATGGTDTGVLALVTRDDALATLTPADGDNTQLRVDSTGALWVRPSGTVTVDGSGVTQPVSNAGLTELAAAINSSKVDVNIVSSDVATGGTSAADDADFTAGTTAGTPAMGVYESTPTSVTDGDLGTVGITTGRRMKTSATIDAALPAGTNNIGDVDVLSMPVVAVTQSGTWDEVGINDSGNSITVDNAQLSVVGSGTEATAMRVTIATDSTGVLSVDDNGGSLTVDGTITEASGAGILTAVQLIDDVVYVDDTATHSTGSSKGVGIMAAATPTDGSVNANDIGMVAMTTDRKLHVAVMDALPAGTAAIGKLAANSGVDIGDVDITSIAAGDNNIGNVDIVSGTITTVSTVTTLSTLTGGGIAHDSADSGNPHKIGFKAYSPDGTTPGTAVAEGDRTDAKSDLDGRQLVNDEHPRWWSYHVDGSSALTDASVAADPGDGFQVVITNIVVSSGAATAMNMFLEEGSTKIFGPIYLEAVAGRGFCTPAGFKKHVTASTAVTITTSAAIAHSVDIQGYIQAV